MRPIRLRTKVQDVAGQAKEKVGQASGDEEAEDRGKGDQVKSDMKDAGEKVKDAFRE